MPIEFFSRKYNNRKININHYKIINFFFLKFFVFSIDFHSYIKELLAKS